MTSTVLISATTGIVGLIVGLLIGYYKSRAEFTEKLARMITKADCSDCDLRGYVSNLTKDLDVGSKAFKEIRADMSDMKGDIRAIKAIMQERAGKIGG